MPKTPLSTSLSFPTAERAYAALESWSRKAEELVRGRLPKLPIADRWRSLPLPLVGFVVAFLLLFLRSPQLFLHAEFYIEDGPEFFGKAYNLGPISLFRDYAGYFHAYPRLVSQLATFLPLAYAPRFLAFGAIAAQAWSAAFFLSDRMARQIPSLKVRAILASIIVAYPYQDDMFANVAHSQWYLSILGASIVFADPPSTRIARIVDYLAIAMIGFTGPFSILLAPAAWVMARGNRHRTIVAAILTVNAIVTFWSIQIHPRQQGHLGRFALFLQVMSHQVVTASLQGEKRVFDMHREGDFSYFFSWKDFGITLAMFGVFLYAFVKGPELLKFLIVLGFFMFISASLTGGSWIVLGNPGVGERYFFVLGFAFLFAIIRLRQETPSASLRWVTRLCGLMFLVGIVQNWKMPDPDPHFDYLSQLAKYEGAPRGVTISIDTPIGRWTERHWVTKLVKR